MSRYPEPSSHYTNFRQNTLNYIEPHHRISEKKQSFVSPQYSAVIQVNPTEEDQSWLQKILFQQQKSSHYDQNLAKPNRNGKYDYLNRKQNLYDFSKKVQSQSLIRKNIAKQQGTNLDQNIKKYTNQNDYNLSYGRPVYQHIKNPDQQVKNRNQVYNRRQLDLELPYKGQQAKQNQRIWKSKSKANLCSANKIQNNEIDEVKLKKIQQKIKNYSYKNHYSNQYKKQDSQAFRNITSKYGSYRQPDSKKNNPIHNFMSITNSNANLHRCTPTFDRSQMNQLQIIRKHFDQIFNQLTDQKQMSCLNCDLSRISQDVKYLLGPIFGQLKIKKTVISKQDFVLKALKLIIDYQFQQINQLLASCSQANVKNITKRSQISPNNKKQFNKNDTYIGVKNAFMNKQNDYLLDHKAYQNIKQNYISKQKSSQIEYYRKPLGQNNRALNMKNSPNKLETVRKGPSKSPYMKVFDSNQPSFQMQTDPAQNHTKKVYGSKITLTSKPGHVTQQKYGRDEDLSVLQKLQSKFEKHFSLNKNLQGDNLEQLSFDQLIRYS